MQAEVNEKSRRDEMTQRSEQQRFDTENALNEGLTNHHELSCHQPKDRVPALPPSVQQAGVLQPSEVLFIQALTIYVDLV